MPPPLTLIAAIARNGVIGKGNALPWHLPEDLRRFKALTTGQAVIMGRKTWDSLPAKFRPLPNRLNIVVTRNPAWRAAGAEQAPSLDAALALAADAARAFVIGGGELYHAALAQAAELVLTEIEREFDGDARFPDFDRSVFRERSREPHHAAPPNDFDYAFVTYRRIAG